MKDSIIIKNANVHNLKNISVEIPRNKLVVITGLSGSGKSSLAFDTIYAEGQRRYVESLSSYARQFLGVMNKPDVEQISGLSPAIAIDQIAYSYNPRSTVGTITEIYDYLRLLFARVGRMYCYQCGAPICAQTADQITDQILNNSLGTSILVLAPIVVDQKGEHKRILDSIKKTRYNKIRLDGEIIVLEEVEDLQIEQRDKHTLEIVMDQFELCSGLVDRSRILEVVEKSLELSNGLVMIEKIKDANETTRNAPRGTNKKQDQQPTIVFSKNFSCVKCSIHFEMLEPRSFSFNSPHGACPVCNGLGTKLEIDQDLLIPNKKLTLAQGAVMAFTKIMISYKSSLEMIESFISPYGFSINTPVNELTKKQLDIVLYGIKSKQLCHSLLEYGGIIPELEKRYKETDSDYIRQEIEKYMRVKICPVCVGKRLRPESLAVTVYGKNISEVVNMTVTDLRSFVSVDLLGQKQFKDKKENVTKSKSLKKNGAALKDSDTAQLTSREAIIANQLLREICKRLVCLEDVGLDYLTLSRSTTTLSRGEAQRIRLATYIGSQLVGVTYVLDEPSIGLHPRDNVKLIATMKQLRDLGNTVIVVEHDQETMLAADYIIDIGPGAGENGGQIVGQGTPKEFKKLKDSCTAQYLNGTLTIVAPKIYRKGFGTYITIHGAKEFNLKNIDVKIPLGKLVVITGVSGSGKSTLITDILAKALANKFYNAKDLPGAHKTILGMEYLDKVVTIDQSPIGQTPRSNPATYTGVFTLIRDLFSQLPEAKVRGFDPGKFSFNVVGGRCEGCQGGGVIKIEMQFLSDVYVDCEECHGARYQPSSLEVYYKGKNISEVLHMTIDTALTFFKNIPHIETKLKILEQVGLNYIKLGQSATTLSGGEAQRVKLATELSRRATGKTLYILDEPTTGLHFEDIKKLLIVLNQLVDKGNTIVIIEHNLDVIKSADWIIDLGPEGGDKGGYLVGCGTPRDIIKLKNSYTAQALKDVM